jgi:hypothetical protein
MHDQRRASNLADVVDDIEEARAEVDH